MLRVERFFFVCECARMCVHALPFDQPPQTVQPHKRAQSLSLCTFLPSCLFFCACWCQGEKERLLNGLLPAGEKITR